MGFNILCSPGRDAAAGFVQADPQSPALVLHLDPVDLAIQLPSFPGGDLVLAEFCRELAREAAQLAAEIDPDGEPAPPDRPARCLVILGSSGGGC
jgi:hypothetical protein